MPEPFAYTRIFSAWHEQAFTATPALKSTLLCDSELYPRFVAQYRTLQALSRQGRRAIERRWKRSISAIALLLALNQTAALAATIGVNDGTIVGNDFNLFGRNSNGTALYGFAPVGSDQLLAVPLSEILDTKLDFNGGSTQSHALVSGSPAIDAIPSANCFSSYDQRNGLRPEDGDGNGTFMCDVGAIEQVSDPPVCDFEVISSGCTVNGIAGQSCGGTSGDDTIVGTSGNDVIVGLARNDGIAGGEGNDRICGGAGNDTLTGESGNDRLFGESGSDRVRGRDDNDALFGGRGIDTCGAGPEVDFTKDCETIGGIR